MNNIDSKVNSNRIILWSAFDELGQHLWENCTSTWSDQLGPKWATTILLESGANHEWIDPDDHHTNEKEMADLIKLLRAIENQPLRFKNRIDSRQTSKKAKKLRLRRNDLVHELHKEYGTGELNKILDEIKGFPEAIGFPPVPSSADLSLDDFSQSDFDHQSLEKENETLRKEIKQSLSNHKSAEKDQKEIIKRLQRQLKTEKDKYSGLQNQMQTIGIKASEKITDLSNSKVESKRLYELAEELGFPSKDLISICKTLWKEDPENTSLGTKAPSSNLTKNEESEIKTKLIKELKTRLIKQQIDEESVETRIRNFKSRIEKLRSDNKKINTENKDLKSDIKDYKSALEEPKRELKALKKELQSEKNKLLSVNRDLKRKNNELERTNSSTSIHSLQAQDSYSADDILNLWQHRWSISLKPKSKRVFRESHPAMKELIELPKLYVLESLVKEQRLEKVLTLAKQASSKRHYDPADEPF